MVLRIAEIIQQFYPELDMRIFPVVQDYGDGAYLRRDLWPVNELGDAPTEEKLKELEEKL